jgi:hypothetical protein
MTNFLRKIGIGLCILSLVVTPGVLHAAVAFDAQSSAGTLIAASTLTWSHTVAGGTDNVLVVGVSSRTGSLPTSVTYNGSAMTYINDIGTGSFDGLSQYYIKNPSSGAHNIVVTMSGNTGISGTGVSVTGADPTTPIGNINQQRQGSATTIGLSLTLSTGSMAVNAFSATAGTPPFVGTPNAGVKRAEANGTGSNQTYGASATNSSGTDMGWSWSSTATGLNALSVEIKAPPVVSSVDEAINFFTIFGY